MLAEVSVISEMTSRLLGLLGVVLRKVHLLNVTRWLCEQFSGTLNDG
jgi:hypothetical protein